ncbi:MAG: hypothetical protein ACTHN3_11145 [Solirubrobacterales bacterium]
MLFAVFAVPAQAAPETIVEYGEGAGQVRGPSGIAIDRSSGDFYIADRGNFRIDKFDADGHFALAWGWGVRDGLGSSLQTCGPQASPPTSYCFPGVEGNGPGAVAPEAVGVDQSSGDVYVADGLKRRVTKFTSTGQFVFMVGRNVNETKVALEGGATQAEKNICTAASGDTCEGGETGTGPNEFTFNIRSLAVDSASVVWVGDTERLTSFDANGTAGPEVALPGAGNTLSLALDSADNFYVVSESLPGVRKLEASTGTLLETLDAGGQPRTVTLDEADKVYVGDATNPYRFKIYGAGGEQAAQFGAGQVIGEPEGNALAVDGNASRLYVASSRSSESESVVQAFPLPDPGPLPENQHVENLQPTTVTLAADLNPEGHETSYHFKWGTSEAYGENTPTETLAGKEFDSEPVAAQLEELVPSTTYHFRLCATNSAGTVCGPDTTFTTPPAVVIDPEWASNVSAHSATVNAELNPLGVEAEAWLEYGTDEGYGQVVPLANLGEGFAPVVREAALSSLQAATTYHFRFAARDERDGIVYTVHGPDRTFTTQFGGIGFELPDKRVWEMVSPSDKHGARLFLGGEIHLQASVDGNGLAYSSYLSTETDPEGNRIIESSMNLARRNASGGWSSKDITPPNDRVKPVPSGNGGEYKLFNPDLSASLLEPRSGTPLSPEASERTPYWRQNTEPPVYRPLVTDKEGFADVPPGTGFGGEDEPSRAIPRVRIQAATPGLDHVILKSEVSFGSETATNGLYEWTDGQLDRVSVLTTGEMVAGSLGSGESSVRGAISGNGSRVFWTAESSKQLYVRDIAAGETGRIDVVQPGGSGAGAVNPIFQGANAAGTVVFFTDSQQLTEDASSGGFDLYRCELPSGSVASGCATLTDISVAEGAGKKAEVQGIAAAIAGDGQTIYFVADGVLDSAPNQLGQSAVASEPNLYVWQKASGVRFIGTLSGTEGANWGIPQGVSFPGSASWLSAAASPSGRYFTFMSKRALTNADTRDATSGEAVEEVYRYDAAIDQLECVSCNPSGSRTSSLIPAVPSLVDPRKTWEKQPAAGILPEAVSIFGGNLGGITLYRPRAVLDNGRVFFNAADSLVPADSNGQWDVYQYEPLGVGDCTASSGGAATTRSAGGCVSLISSGTGEEEAGFMDASASGDDAFFLTPAQLSVFDEDHELDVYDARVRGIAATRPVSSECLGEACQPAAQAPNDPTPASAAFNGAGNVPARKRCAKGKRRVSRHGRARCVARKHNHRAAKSRRAHR